MSEKKLRLVIRKVKETDFDWIITDPRGQPIVESFRFFDTQEETIANFRSVKAAMAMVDIDEDGEE